MNADLCTTVGGSHENGQSIQQGVDWTQLPDACRLLVVRLMDSDTRAAWRTVCRLTCQDVHAATLRLSWQGQNSQRRSSVPLPRDISSMPSHLSAALIVKLSFHRLPCDGMLCSMPATLTALDLTGAPIRGDDMPVLASAVRFHSATLRSITLTDMTCHDHYFMGPSNFASLAPSLHDCSALADLRLEGWKLKADGAAALAAALSRSAPSLTSLNLSDNDLGDKGALALAPVLSRMTALVILDLHENKLGPAGAASVASALSSIAPSLTSLNFCGNNLRDEGAAALAPALSRMTALVTLGVRSNDLGLKAMRALSSALLSIAPSIKVLDVAFNPMRDDGFAALVPALRGMTALEGLSCSFGWVGRVGTSTLASILPAMTRLKHLHWAGNHLGFEGLRLLGQALEGLSGQQHWRIYFEHQLLSNGKLCHADDAQALAAIVDGLRCLGSWELDIVPDYMWPIVVWGGAAGRAIGLDVDFQPGSHRGSGRM